MSERPIVVRLRAEADEYVIRMADARRHLELPAELNGQERSEEGE